ncbi:MAG TPA: hypothetical protein VF681_10555 [Abditibacteriaceae bacterium]
MNRSELGAFPAFAYWNIWRTEPTMWYAFVLKMAWCVLANQTFTLIG